MYTLWARFMICTLAAIIKAISFYCKLHEYLTSAIVGKKKWYPETIVLL